MVDGYKNECFALLALQLYTKWGTISLVADSLCFELATQIPL